MPREVWVYESRRDYTRCPVVDFLKEIIGSGKEATELTVLQVCLRAVIVFVAALFIVRFADKRFFARKSAFDYILGFVLASLLARCIAGSQQILPSLTAAFLLAALHRALGAMACRWPQLGGVIKGGSETLIEDGRTHIGRLEKHHLSTNDLEEELRLNGVESAESVKLARLERSGDISVIKKE